MDPNKRLNSDAYDVDLLYLSDVAPILNGTDSTTGSNSESVTKRRAREEVIGV